MGLLSFLSSLFGGGSTRLSPRTFVAERDPAHPVLDVRSPGEFASGHLAGAINVDIHGPDFAGQVEKLAAAGTVDREQPVYLYCRSGARSGRAARILRQQGFEQAWNVGGFGALRSAGAKVNR